MDLNLRRTVCRFSIWKLNTDIVERMFTISLLISFSNFGQEKLLAVFKEPVAGLVLREYIVVSA